MGGVPSSSQKEILALGGPRFNSGKSSAIFFLAFINGTR